VVDPEAALTRDRLGQRCHCLFVEVFDGPAGGANQVMVMAGLTPDVGGDVTGSLEPLRQPGGDQGVERPKHRRPAEVSFPVCASTAAMASRWGVSRTPVCCSAAWAPVSTTTK
jgi:hypothetical protein